MVAATRVEGRQFLKLTLLNPMASVEDVLGVVDAACAAARALSPVAPPPRPPTPRASGTTTVGVNR